MHDVVFDAFRALRTEPLEVRPEMPEYPEYPGYAVETDALDSMDIMASRSHDDRFAGVTVADLEILRRLAPVVRKFSPPNPVQSSMQFALSRSAKFGFRCDDFHISFSPFLKALPPDLQMARPAVETNR